MSLAGCGSSSEKKPAPDRPTEPRGAGAYDGQREARTGELGDAPDGKLVAAGGAETTLAALRGETTAVVVFYRGHW
jgi:hypothetical protein